MRCAEFEDSIAGPIRILDEPDKSDDERNTAHGKYMQLMQDYIDSFAEVHRTHKIMMDFYKDNLAEIRECRTRMLE